MYTIAQEWQDALLGATCPDWRFLIEDLPIKGYNILSTKDTSHSLGPKLLSFD